jgi:hypothetical protein
MTCPYSGCNSPEGECLGECTSDSYAHAAVIGLEHACEEAHSYAAVHGTLKQASSQHITLPAFNPQSPVMQALRKSLARVDKALSQVLITQEK